MLPEAVDRRAAIEAAIASSYARFGYRRVETPALEDVERLTSGQGGENEKLIYKVLRRGLPDEVPAGSRLSELVDLGLRYDLTVPLTRLYANNQDRLERPFRALQVGSVWRAERPARGRFRQFTQCDIDVIGEPSVLAECELLEATLTTLASLGVLPLEARLNDRRLLFAIAGACAVPVERTGEFFVSLDKREKIGWEGVRSELESHGFESATAAGAERLIESLAEGKTPEGVIGRLAADLPAVDAAVLDDLGATAGALEALAARLEGVSVVLDPTVVRGMGYYTGQIFELTHPSSSGSVAGGGRYDDLVGRSLGRPVPACGISIGFERITDLAVVSRPDLGVALLYGDEPAAVVLEAARSLRAAGRPATAVPRRKAMRRQLDALAAEGYSSFATIEQGQVSAERQLSEA